VPPASTNAIWPLSLALGVGLAVGFAAGYALGRTEGDNGNAGRTDAPPAVTAAAPPVVSAAPAAEPPRPETEVRLAPDAPPPSAVPDAPPAAAGAGAIKPAPPRPAPAAPARNGRIIVRSTPAGARVLVDGRDVGKTPLTVPNLSRGSHTVRVMRDGYATQDRRVNLASRASTTLTVRLPRAAAPSAPQTVPLMVDSRPPGATVFLDNKRVGTTPMSISGVAIGSHAVRLELAGYKPWTASVRIVAGEPHKVAASLEQ
jgi:hypothetical protein